MREEPARAPEPVGRTCPFCLVSCLAGSTARAARFARTFAEASGTLAEASLAREAGFATGTASETAFAAGPAFATKTTGAVGTTFEAGFRFLKTTFTTGPAVAQVARRTLVARAAGRPVAELTRRAVVAKIFLADKLFAIAKIFSRRASAGLSPRRTFGPLAFWARLLAFADDAFGELANVASIEFGGARWANLHRL